VESTSEVASDLIEEAKAQPALVLLALDSSYTDLETLHTLYEIQSAWPGARTAVLVADEKQYRVVQSVGVDLILFEGIIAAQLLKQIDALLPRAGL
jgi:hypothetical protein